MCGAYSKRLVYFESEYRIADMNIKTLQEALACGIIDEDTVQRTLEVKRKENIIKKHPYAISQLTDGRWQTYYKDAHMGKRREIRARSREILLDKLVEIYESNDKSHTLNSLFEDWLKYKSTITESKNTLVRHKQHYKRYFAQTDLFNRRIDSIKFLELQSFCNQIVREYNLTSKEWCNIKIIPKGIFEYAVENGIVKENLMNRVKISVKYRQVTRKTGETQTFNELERDALFKFLEGYRGKKQYPAALAIEFNFLVGLRVGELVALKWEDVNLNRRLLHVCREEICDRETWKHVVTEHTKTYQDRFVPLVPAAIDYLNIMRDLSDSEYIFSFGKERINARRIEHLLRHFSEVKGLPTKRSHKIRKTYGSNLSAGNVPIDEIRKLLGHNNLTTTMAYLFNPYSDSKTYELVSSCLQPSSNEKGKAP